MYLIFTLKCIKLELHLLKAHQIHFWRTPLTILKLEKLNCILPQEGNLTVSRLVI